ELRYMLRIDELFGFPAGNDGFRGLIAANRYRVRSQLHCASFDTKDTETRSGELEKYPENWHTELRYMLRIDGLFGFAAGNDGFRGLIAANRYRIRSQFHCASFDTKDTETRSGELEKYPENWHTELRYMLRIDGLFGFPAGNDGFRSLIAANRYRIRSQ